MFRAWAAGCCPDHRPTMADLWGLACGWHRIPIDDPPPSAAMVAAAARRAEDD